MSFQRKNLSNLVEGLYVPETQEPKKHITGLKTTNNNDHRSYKRLIGFLIQTVTFDTTATTLNKINKIVSSSRLLFQVPFKIKIPF